MKKNVKNILKKISDSLPSTKTLFMFISAIIMAALLYSVFMLLIVK